MSATINLTVDLFITGFMVIINTLLRNFGKRIKMVSSTNIEHMITY